MDKVLILLFTLAISFSVSGQETKQVKKNHGDSDYLEIFNVLKSNKNIKHGLYEKYFKYKPHPTIQDSNPSNKELLVERGQYDNNKKTGTWSFYWGESNIESKGLYENDLKNGNWEYFKNGVVIEKGDFKNDKREGLWTYFEKDKGILERGYYKDGKKIGKWTYYYYNIPIQIYDHSIDSVLQSFNDSTESEAIIDSSNQIVKVILSRTPQYIGYKRQLQSDIEEIEYPIEARQKGLDGKVIVSFIVNEDGTTNNFSIIQDIGGNCGQAVIKAFKANTSKKWIPGIYNGKKVKVKYYQTVSFSLTMDPISGLGQSDIVLD